LRLAIFVLAGWPLYQWSLSRGGLADDRCRRSACFPLEPGEQRRPQSMTPPMRQRAACDEARPSQQALEQVCARVRSCSGASRF